MRDRFPRLRFYDRSWSIGRLDFSPGVPFTFAPPFRDVRRARTCSRNPAPKREEEQPVVFRGGGDKKYGGAGGSVSYRETRARGERQKKEDARDRRCRSRQPVQRGLVFRRARRSAGAFLSFLLSRPFTVINKHDEAHLAATAPRLRSTDRSIDVTCAICVTSAKIHAESFGGAKAQRRGTFAECSRIVSSREFSCEHSANRLPPGGVCL